MTNLTTFSKIIIVLGIVGFFSLFGIMCYNCSKSQPAYPQQTYQQTAPVQDHGDYQVVNQPGGSQVVVVKDHSGSEFLMDMIQFQMLMNMAGGMNNVYGYYNQHRYDPDWDRDQSSYRTKTKTVINNYYGSSVDDSRPISDQVKQKEVEYRKSNGFSKPTITQPSKTSEPTGNQSKGFTNKWFSTPTNTPSPTYQKSDGFKSKSQDPYKSSSGFKSQPANKSYTPSKGFSKPSNSSSYKSSSGFGKKKN